MADPEVDMGPTLWFLKPDRPGHFQISALPLSRFVTIGKLFNHSVFPFVKRGLRMPALKGSKC